MTWYSEEEARGWERRRPRLQCTEGAFKVRYSDSRLEHEIDTRLEKNHAPLAHGAGGDACAPSLAHHDIIETYTICR